MKRTILGAILCASLPLLAAPNFTGSWKLNASKSEFGPMPPPDSMSMKIDHQEPKLAVATKQSRDGNDFESTANYTTDGKECTNEFRGNPRKSTLKWDGDVLVIESKGKFGDNEYTSVEKWTLSADGKTLSIARHMASSMGEMDTKSTLERQ
jgi:hypothetical protein